jgi:AP-1 complex subunit mu
VTPRSICEEYFSVVINSEEKDMVKPIIVSEEHETYLFHYSRHNLVYMCVTKKENPALLFSRFLEHVDHILCDFFGEEKVDEKIRINFIYLYMVFDELIDGGFPNICEPNLLKEMMDPPGLFGHSSGTIIVF